MWKIEGFLMLSSFPMAIFDLFLFLYRPKDSNIFNHITRWVLYREKVEDFRLSWCPINALFFLFCSPSVLLYVNVRCSFSRGSSKLLMCECVLVASVLCVCDGHKLTQQMSTNANWPWFTRPHFFKAILCIWIHWIHRSVSD